jgi:hypothetical protein
VIPRLAQTIVLFFCAVPMTMELDASILTFQFSGNSIFGTILIDNSAPDSNPDPQKGLYHNAIVGYATTIDGAQNNFGQQVFTMLQGSSGDVVIGLEADGVGACGLSVDCLAFILGRTFLQEGPADYDLTFYYPPHSFLSDAIPGTVPSSGAGILRSDIQQFFLGSTASTSIVIIPEPKSIIQLVLGLAVASISRAVSALSARRVESKTLLSAEHQFILAWHYSNTRPCRGSRRPEVQQAITTGREEF